ncbi:hypothetical protein AK812_SmicGene26101 [Symbiodinium microadriaticum]|uniref:JmjC domain-containing protein n=1 Tax=Symbiodinium microadriaticum TaxID=2951 RepID=A0A1Q9DAE5_SYMMI|nr:hypothetical protein AK812_SmicGene26101 [Symbiodinium microadriaticum]
MKWLLAFPLAATTEIAPRCDFEVVQADLLQEGFESEYVHPILIQGTPWERERASLASFRRVFGNYTVRLTHNLEFQSRAGSKPEANTSTFGEWADSLFQQQSVPYVFEFCAKDLCQQIESTYGIPPYLKNSCLSLYMNTGTIAKGVAFHQHRQTWGWLLAGRKVWYVAPPGTLKFQPHKHVDEERLGSARAASGVQRCLQEEGEIVFLPRDWWHATFNKAEWNLAIGGQGEISSSAFDAVRGADAAKIRKLPKEEVKGVLQSAVENGHREVLELLISAKARVFPQGREGWTAVHEAASNVGDRKLLEMLVKHKLDLAATDGAGKVVAHHHPSEPVLAFLLEQRAELSAADAGGVTVAHEAAMRGHVASLRLLAQAGISLTDQCSNGATPAHFAAFDGHTGVLRELLASRADLHALDHAGGTLLHHAASQGQTSALSWLLGEGVRAGPDSFGRTLMHEAAATGFPDAMQLLRQHGQDPDAQDGDGRSVAQYAAEGGHAEVLKQLVSWGVDLRHLDREAVEDPAVLELLSEL